MTPRDAKRLCKCLTDRGVAVEVYRHWRPTGYSPPVCALRFIDGVNPGLIVLGAAMEHLGIPNTVNHSLVGDGSLIVW